MVLSLTNTRSRATTFRQLKHGTDCKFVFFMCRYDLVTERLVTFPACDMFEVDGWRKESSKILWSDFSQLFHTTRIRNLQISKLADFTILL